MVGELSQEFLRSQRAAKLAEKMCQCYDLCQALVERRMQPARGRFARFDLDRQIASTFPAHWKVGPAPCQCGQLRYRRHTEAKSRSSIAGICRSITKKAT